MKKNTIYGMTIVAALGIGLMEYASHVTAPQDKILWKEYQDTCAKQTGSSLKDQTNTELGDIVDRRSPSSDKIWECIWTDSGAIVIESDKD